MTMHVYMCVCVCYMCAGAQTILSRMLLTLTAKEIPDYIAEGIKNFNYTSIY